jgi:hypothetical protein
LIVVLSDPMVNWKVLFAQDHDVPTTSKHGGGTHWACFYKF